MSDFYSLATIIRPCLPLTCFPLSFYSNENAKDSIYLQLCLVKRDGLEIWSTPITSSEEENTETTTTTLSMSLTIPIPDRLLKVIPIPNSNGTDSLFILTTSLQYCLLSTPTPITLERGTLAPLVMPGLLLPTPLTASDTLTSKTTTFIAMHLSQGLLDLMVVDCRRADPRFLPSSLISSPNPHVHQRRIEEIEVIDICFIPTGNTSTSSTSNTPRSLLAVLHRVPGGNKELSLYDVYLSQPSGSLTLERSVFAPPTLVPPSATTIIAIPRTTTVTTSTTTTSTKGAGIIILGVEEIMYWTTPTSFQHHHNHHSNQRRAPSHQAVIATMPTQWTSHTILPNTSLSSAQRLILSTASGAIFCLFLDPLSLTYLGTMGTAITSVAYHTDGQLFVTTEVSPAPVLVKLLTRRNSAGSLLEVGCASSSASASDQTTPTIIENICTGIVDINALLDITTDDTISTPATVDTEMISTTIISFPTALEGRWSILLSDGTTYLYSNEVIYCFSKDATITSIHRTNAPLLGMVVVSDGGKSRSEVCAVQEDGIYVFTEGGGDGKKILSTEIISYSADAHLLFLLQSNGKGGIVFCLKSKKVLEDIVVVLEIAECPTAMLLKDMVLYVATAAAPFVIAYCLQTTHRKKTFKMLPSEMSCSYITSLASSADGDSIIVGDSEGRCCFISVADGDNALTTTSSSSSITIHTLSMAGTVGPVEFYTTKHSTWAMSLGHLYFWSHAAKGCFVFSGKVGVRAVSISSTGLMCLLKDEHVEFVEPSSMAEKKNLLFSVVSGVSGYSGGITTNTSTTSSATNTKTTKTKYKASLRIDGFIFILSTNALRKMKGATLIDEYILPFDEEGCTLSECHSMIIVSTTKTVLTMDINYISAVIASFPVTSRPVGVVGMVVWNYKVIVVATSGAISLYRWSVFSDATKPAVSKTLKMSRKTKDKFQWVLESQFLACSSCISLDVIEDRIAYADSLFSIRLLKIALGRIGEDFMASLSFVELARSRDPSFRYRYSSPTALQFIDPSKVLVADTKERISVFSFVPRTPPSLRGGPFWKLRLECQIGIGEQVSCMRRKGSSVYIGTCSGALLKLSLLAFTEFYCKLSKVQQSVCASTDSFDPLYWRNIVVEDGLGGGGGNNNNSNNSNYNNNHRLLDVSVLERITEMSSSERRKHLQHLSSHEMKNLSLLLEKLGSV